MIRLKQATPSFCEHRLDVIVPGGFLATNASVTTHDGKIVAAVNAIDHFLTDQGYFCPLDPDHNPRKAASNLTYIARLNDDLSIESANALSVPAELFTPPWEFRGLESPRLFSWDGRLFIIGCSSGTGDAPGAELYLGRIVDDAVVDVHKLAPRNPAHAEKNWMPEVTRDGLRFHYRLGVLIAQDGSPHRVGRRDDLEHLHGGTQILPWEGGAFCIVHTYSPVEGTFRKRSRQHFARLDRAGAPIAITDPIDFGGSEVEVATGMAYHPDGKRLMISYGRDGTDPDHPHQERPFIATLAVNDLGRIL